LLIFSLALPIAGWAGATSFGTVRGTRGVEVTFNGGKTWVPLTRRALPLVQDVVMRSKRGHAQIVLVDGSRLTVLPSDILQLRDVDGTIEVVLVRGRLTFQLPPDSRVAILTPQARLTPVRQQASAGEVFVSADNVVGVKMAEGTVQVQELADPGQVMLASLEPVFVPAPPASQGVLFVSDVVDSPAPGAKGVFTPEGESLGYLQPDGRLVIQPGFTADLTRPFPSQLVRLAMATIPDDSRGDSTPLFDVNGKYLGYLNGVDFHPQTQLAQAFAGGAGAAGLTGADLLGVGSIFGVGGTLIGLGVSGTFSPEEAPPPATPIQPGR
jgi:hypothetical protein